jgi:hypothetical protein
MKKIKKLILPLSLILALLLTGLNFIACTKGAGECSLCGEGGGNCEYGLICKRFTVMNNQLVYEDEWLCATNLSKCSVVKK